MEEVKKDPHAVTELLKLPLRNDGMPNLNDVQGFIYLNRFSNLSDMLFTYRKTTEGSCSRVMLEKAIASKKSEIALKLAKFLGEENITFEDAISILDLTKKKIEDSKFTL